MGQYEFDQLFGADNAFEANAEFLARLHGEDPLGLNFLRGRTVDAHTLTKNELMLLLFSEENSMLDPAYVNTEASEEYLSAPLSHYWINSSQGSAKYIKVLRFVRPRTFRNSTCTFFVLEDKRVQCPFCPRVQILGTQLYLFFFVLYFRENGFT